MVLIEVSLKKIVRLSLVISDRTEQYYCHVLLNEQIGTQEIDQQYKNVNFGNN